MSKKYLNRDLDAHNYITEFMYATEEDDTEITGSIKAVIAQFLHNFRLEMNDICRKQERPWITVRELFDAQIKELKNCILDLEAAKKKIKVGEKI